MKPIGGSCTFKDGTAGTSEQLSVCASPYDMAEAVPWMLVIPSAVGPVGEVVAFPRRDVEGVWAGILPDWADPASGPFDAGQLAVVLEYGAAGANQIVTFDHIPGCYNIPPSDFVRVSLFANNLDAGASVPATYRLALVPNAQAAGARVPTVTGLHRFAAAGNANLGVPPPAKAKAFEVWSTTPQNVVVDQVGAAGNPAARRDSLGLVYTPPWTPVDFDETLDSDIRVTVTAACDVVFRFYLGL